MSFWKEDVNLLLRGVDVTLQQMRQVSATHRSLFTYASRYPNVQSDINGTRRRNNYEI